jgi:hypothetical protein
MLEAYDYTEWRFLPRQEDQVTFPRPAWARHQPDLLAVSKRLMAECDARVSQLRHIAILFDPI